MISFFDHALFYHLIHPCIDSFVKHRPFISQADRVLVMSKGNVVMEGTPKEVFSQTEKVRALRLDVPQAAELRDELVKAGIPMPEGIIDTGACAQALYELLK